MGDALKLDAASDSPDHASQSMVGGSEIPLASSVVPTSLGSEKQKTEEFLMKEFEALRSEIDLQIAERRKIEGQLLVGLPIFYSWALTQDAVLDPTVYNSLLLVPVLASGLGALRWCGLMLTVIHLGKYIYQIERSFLDETFGWETYMNRRRRKAFIVGQLEGWSGVAFWVVVLIIVTYSAYFLWRVD